MPILHSHSITSLAIASFDKILLRRRSEVPAGTRKEAKDGLKKAGAEWRLADKSKDGAQQEFVSMFDDADFELQGGDVDHAVAAVDTILQRGTDVTPMLRAGAQNGLIRAPEPELEASH